MSGDGKLTEKIQAAFLDEKPWRAAVEAVMRHEGYTDEEIVEAYGPVVHTDECTDNGYPFGYDCTDEEGRDQHPLHTRSAELDNTYRLFFEESNLAAAVLPIIAAEVRKAQADAWDEGQKSGLRYADRAIVAHKMGRPDLPGPPSCNPYREQED